MRLRLLFNAVTTVPPVGQELCGRGDGKRKGEKKVIHDIFRDLKKKNYIYKTKFQKRVCDICAQPNEIFRMNSLGLNLFCFFPKKTKYVIISLLVC